MRISLFSIDSCYNFTEFDVRNLKMKCNCMEQNEVSFGGNPVLTTISLSVHNRILQEWIRTSQFLFYTNPRLF